ncbi:tyrosine recombinase [Caulobacter phage CcrPW]|uniref:Integrase n=1 Tax=Caulobacter phage CcrPW TaxID=2283271 RepID=A0A385EA17_9CAUD|nr:tyrosine recombinase [Caulobacter phage CcrPW]AXQ68731.1 tyrosine recombinase [Caulobacter phage CcrPW]
MAQRSTSRKRAKVLDRAQFDALLPIVRASKTPLRDEVALRLSFSAGLRACEIANLRWYNNLLGPTGKLLENIHITGDVAKRSIERVIPIEPELAKLLRRLRRQRPEDEYVFFAVHNYQTPMVKDPKNPKKKVINPTFTLGKVQPTAVIQFFRRLYRHAGYVGCSSHSGRRTFTTVKARQVGKHGCSIEDVRDLVGHKRLDTTASYIEPSDNRRALISADW